MRIASALAEREEKCESHQIVGREVLKGNPRLLSVDVSIIWR
jgi:hypothetical protein